MVVNAHDVIFSSLVVSYKGSASTSGQQ